MFFYAIEECLLESNCSSEIDDDETILNWMTNYLYTWNPLELNFTETEAYINKMYGDVA